MGQKHAKKHVEILPISLGGPLDPIHPVWGHLVITLFGRAGTTVHLLVELLRPQRFLLDGRLLSIKEAQVKLHGS